MKPFEALQTGQATASRSIDLKYTSLPPQMTIWRALNARHFLLVVVCSDGLSANILAVVLNNLLNPRMTLLEVNWSNSEPFTPDLSLIGSDASHLDHAYIAAANFSHNAPLPPWTAQDRYYIPFQTNGTSQIEGIQSYKAITTGSGVNVNCTQIDWENPTYSLLGDIVAQPKVHYLDETGVECIRTWNTYYDSWKKADGALELLAPLGPNSPNATMDDHDMCGGIIAVGFNRAKLNADVLGSDTIFTSSTWMMCESVKVAGQYEVQVNSIGHIQQATLQNHEYSYDERDHDLKLSNLYLTYEAPFNNGTRWQNDTFRDSWPGFLVKALTASNALIDPSLPAPAFNDIGPAVENLLYRLFPIILSLQLSETLNVTSNHAT